MLTGIGPKTQHIENAVKTELKSRDRQIENLNQQIIELKHQTKEGKSRSNRDQERELETVKSDLNAA
jgi:hypothetical protein